MPSCSMTVDKKRQMARINNIRKQMDYHRFPLNGLEKTRFALQPGKRPDYFNEPMAASTVSRISPDLTKAFMAL